MKNSLADCRIKRDAAWKPLIRNFRRYLKKDALDEDQAKKVYNAPLEQQGKLFCQAMGLPEHLTDQPWTQMAVFMMINSHRITRNKRLVPEAKKIMGRSAGAIWEKYYEVFNENSHKRRSVFFKDPAV